MSTHIEKRSSALPSIEKARVLLAQCRSVQECQKIKALAQAVASCSAVEEARDEASKIVLLAKARVGELTKEGAKAVPAKERNPSGGIVPRRNDTRQAKLEAEGLSRKEAAECEKIADLQKSGDLDRMFAKSKTAPTTAGAVALHRLPPAQRKQVLGKLADGADVKRALGEVKLEAKRALAEEIRANPIVTPDGRYQVIVSDPPWKYDTRAEDTSHRGKNQYPDMTTEEICALPVGTLAQDDCVLWLWTTNAFMRDAYRCLDAWGFKEKTILTWDKELLGLGDWLRNVTEHCILAVKGRPVVSLTNQTTIIREKRREHSRKPVAFYDLVEKLCPGSKLEMFSRSPRDGWGAWGAETGKFHAAE
jgi:N6-adenosine-specific RNA methylase IME4